MAITDAEAQDIKNQLLDQLKNVPEASREETRKQIEGMSNEDIEAFIEKQKAGGGGESGCVFCAIVDGKAPAIKVDENEEAVAVLDINPVSKGHTLIIPKDHNKEPTEKSQELAFKVGKQILEKLKPKDITTQAMKAMDHTILNVIPLYEDTNMEKRIKLERKDFEEVRDKISVFPAAPAADTVEKPIPSIKETEVGEVEQDKKGNEIPKEPELENACLFCTIAQGKAQSFQIDENKDNVAILELNPISKGHALVIPKNHVDTTSLPANSFTLAKKIAKKIKTKYKPQDVKINPTSVNNHALIELIPIYEGTDVSKREQADQSELATIQKQLMVKKSTGSTAKKKTESTKTTSPGQKKKRTFNLSKRPKFPDLPQYGPRIP